MTRFRNAVDSGPTPVASSDVSDDFVPGRALSAAFYDEVVAPLLGAHPHSAALLGTGSDVLGFDTVVSTDHGWGPRLKLFVPDGDVAVVRNRIDSGLPARFRGWPVRYGWDEVPVSHHVQVATLSDWLRGQIDLDPRTGMSTLDWLTVPQQALLEVTGGQVYADPDGELTRVRELLAWYPLDVQLWLLACQWQRLDQEESFVGRAAQVGDELGSALIAGRQVRELMRLGFLLSGVYWPYTKWFGTAFARLPIAAELSPTLHRAIAATNFPAREAALIEAGEIVARAHNAAGLTAPVDPTARPFHNRPFQVLGAGRFATACRAAISDPWLRDLPLVGSVDQLADSTDLLTDIDISRRLRAVYPEPPI
jgi:hypothetical protein